VVAGLGAVPPLYISLCTLCDLMLELFGTLLFCLMLGRRCGRSTVEARLGGLQRPSGSWPKS
jgi:hypothetical protein